jgi:hypothetical protein
MYVSSLQIAVVSLLSPPQNHGAMSIDPQQDPTEKEFEWQTEHMFCDCLVRVEVNVRDPK